MTDSDDVVADIYTKIERERKLITGAMQMSKSTDNPGVQAQADNTIREARRNINYLETTLRDLQIRRMGQGVGSMSLGNGGPQQNPAHNGRPTPGAYPGQQQPTGLRQPQGNPYSPQSLGYGAGAHMAGRELPDYGEGGYSDTRNDRSGPPRAPFPPGAPGSPRVAPRPNYSRLDLIKYDTIHLGPKIQLMLSQLEFKLSVEKQYKDGIEKIMGSYKIDGDKKIRKEAEGRRIESVQKIELLKRALKRYEDLHVDVDLSSETAEEDSLNAPSMRKPLTGTLTMRVHAVSDVNHASNTSRFGSSKAPETFVIIKVEDEFKARTKATRTERWTDELHDIDIDKGNEVELTVYDKAGDHPMPIGMLWIRISDIAEEMRRKRIETELQHSGWVPAANAMEDGRTGASNMHFNPPPGQGLSGGASIGGAQYSGANASQPQIGPVVIESWFQLEPVGRIQLSMSFAKSTRERSHFDAGLNRKGAIRQRKEDVHELYGHKFVAQQFYNIMRCALCGELLKYATGMQCADCKYMCHEKCYPLVVTKCITKSNAESDPDEAKLNHRIPHRFEAYGNIGANWCCHCGYILPLGRKACKRCKECKLMCHNHCQHLVPDFCGMSMKDANKILKEIKDAQSNQKGMTKTLRPHPPRPKRQPSTPQTAPDRPLPLTDRTSYTENDAEEQLHASPQYQTPATARQPPSGGLAAASRAYQDLTQQQQQQAQPQTPSKQPPQYDQRPQAVRSESSFAAAAAAANALAASNRTQAPRSPTESRAPRTTSYGPTSPDRQSQSSAPTVSATYNPGDYANIDQGYRMPAAVATPQPPQPQVQPARQYQAEPLKSPPQLQQPQPPQQPQQSQQQSLPTIPQAVVPAQPATAAAVDTVQAAKPDPAANRGSGRRIGLDHFNFLAVLGKGNFGKVMLAETKATKKLYAIKVLKKEFIIENDEVESTRSERDVFIIANKARHPFLLNLHACFQTETRVYFVMEYISGGDLMLHIQRGQFGTKRAQFYAAEVCLALKYFHENGVVYRDLKLDNIMLTLDGHIKVADYGLCKKDMYYGSSTRTFCGTPEFMAPEILLDRPYGRAVDWWAFGVLIYQMLLQQSPFRGEDEDEIYDAILADEPLYPIHMPRDSVSILQKLLTREPELRLGSGPTDAQEIMSHAFFRNINWDDIASKRVPAPFLPSIKSATDTSNFDSEFTSVTPVLTPVQSVLSQAMQEEFRGFSYSADFV